jgi:hypothetical protein
MLNSYWPCYITTRIRFTYFLCPRQICFTSDVTLYGSRNCLRLMNRTVGHSVRRCFEEICYDIQDETNWVQWLMYAFPSGEGGFLTQHKMNVYCCRLQPVRLPVCTLRLGNFWKNCFEMLRYVPKLDANPKLLSRRCADTTAGCSSQIRVEIDSL